MSDDFIVNSSAATKCKGAFVKARPFEVDEQEYPFISRWYERHGTFMHYVDEGAGVPIVFCHGNPTWSYIYRHIIKRLRAHCRCIAYDLPGFGFSDHPADFGYTPQEHAQWVEAFLLDYLKLDTFIIVVQDWGGPIGLSIATRHPTRVLGMVISSTWAWPAGTIARVFSTLMGSRLGQFLILKRNFFATTIVSTLLGARATDATRKAYADPFPTAASRRGTAVFPVQLTKAKPWLAELRDHLGNLAGRPVEFVFGLRDLATRPADMTTWLKHFPDAGVQKITSANHYTQEDCPDNYVVAIERILAKILRSPASVNRIAQ